MLLRSFVAALVCGCFVVYIVELFCYSILLNSDLWYFGCFGRMLLYGRCLLPFISLRETFMNRHCVFLTVSLVGFSMVVWITEGAVILGIWVSVGCGDFGVLLNVFVGGVWCTRNFVWLVVLDSTLFSIGVHSKLFVVLVDARFGWLKLVRLLGLSTFWICCIDVSCICALRIAGRLCARLIMFYRFYVFWWTVVDGIVVICTFTMLLLIVVVTYSLLYSNLGDCMLVLVVGVYVALFGLFYGACLIKHARCDCFCGCCLDWQLISKWASGAQYFLYIGLFGCGLYLVLVGIRLQEFNTLGTDARLGLMSLCGYTFVAAGMRVEVVVFDFCLPLGFWYALGATWVRGCYNLNFVYDVYVLLDVMGAYGLWLRLWFVIYYAKWIVIALFVSFCLILLLTILVDVVVCMVLGVICVVDFSFCDVFWFGFNNFWGCLLGISCYFAYEFLVEFKGRRLVDCIFILFNFYSYYKFNSSGLVDEFMVWISLCFWLVPRLILCDITCYFYCILGVRYEGGCAAEFMFSFALIEHGWNCLCRKLCGEVLLVPLVYLIIFCDKLCYSCIMVDISFRSERGINVIVVFAVVCWFIEVVLVVYLGIDSLGTVYYILSLHVLCLDKAWSCLERGLMLSGKICVFGECVVGMDLFVFEGYKLQRFSVIVGLLSVLLNLVVISSCGCGFSSLGCYKINTRNDYVKVVVVYNIGKLHRCLGYEFDFCSFWVYFDVFFGIPRRLWWCSTVAARFKGHLLHALQIILRVGCLLKWYAPHNTDVSNSQMCSFTGMFNLNDAARVNMYSLACGVSFTCIIRRDWFAVINDSGVLSQFGDYVCGNATFSVVVFCGNFIGLVLTCIGFRWLIRVARCSGFEYLYFVALWLDFRLQLLPWFVAMVLWFPKDYVRICSLRFGFAVLFVNSFIGVITINLDAWLRDTYVRGLRYVLSECLFVDIIDLRCYFVELHLLRTFMFGGRLVLHCGSTRVLNSGLGFDGDTYINYLRIDTSNGACGCLLSREVTHVLSCLTNLRFDLLVPLWYLQVMRFVLGFYGGCDALTLVIEVLWWFLDFAVQFIAFSPYYKSGASLICGVYLIDWFNFGIGYLI
eukprot:gene3270-2252_t